MGNATPRRAEAPQRARKRTFAELRAMWLQIESMPEEPGELTSEGDLASLAPARPIADALIKRLMLPS